MTDAPDAELLAQFARTNSETAFAALVERHIGLVHSVALRHTANPQHAQDITQAVFIILARKAAMLNRKTILPGWLYHTARLTAANFQRAEARRFHREQEAFMQSTLEETAPDALWSELSPLLDKAMAHLGATDRAALVLRYFQNKSLPEVGAALGLEERAAQKRVTRAIEKLRKFFAKRGVSSTTAIIARTISANSIQAAPVALAKSVTAVAVAKSATASISTLTLIKGALKIMAWTKTKSVVVVGVAVILAAGTTSLVIKHQHQTEGSIPQKSRSLAGNVTPEAAFQSSLLVMSKGDMKALMASFTPEFQNHYMKTAGKGKSESELAAMNAKIATMIGNFQAISNEVVSSDETTLHFHAGRMGNASVPMKKIDGEWKINGDITPDAQNNRGR